MAVKVNRIQKMIKKSGLVPAGVYKAEGFFKAYNEIFSYLEDSFSRYEK